MADTMRITATTVPVPVEVNISVENMIDALKKRCGVYDKHDTYYTVENNKLYRHADISYHGSPQYETTLVSDDENIAAMYSAIVAFEDAYKKLQNN